MVRIRLRRIGSKGKALYKIIVADQRSPQKGKYIEEVGTYDPHTNPASINLVEDKISEWISKGAQPSESVYKIFNIAGFDDGGKIKPLILPLCALDFAHMIKTSAIGLFEIHDFSPEIL